MTRPILEDDKTIRPGVKLPSGVTYYPTAREWLMGFAAAGCEWAVEALGVEESK